MRVDFHTHVIPKEIPNFAEKYPGKWPTLHQTCACGANIMVEGNVFREVTDQVWDSQKRIKDMDREGVDIQVLSPIPVTFSYWADVKAATEMAMVQNDFISQTVKENPARFLGLGTVPMQDVKAAVKEMERCVQELNLYGIEIGTNINGENLDAPQFLEFFEKAEEWNVPLFIHPWETLAKDRTPRHNFMYTVGMPSETALAAASLIWSGVLEKFPRLKICFAHGGGSFPYILPRLDQGWEVWPHLRLTPHPPSHYARNFYFDSLNYDSININYLIERFGHDRVLMGSDYPFLLRETPPGKVINNMENLTEEQKRMILGENALRFLNVKEKKLNYGTKSHDARGKAAKSGT
ncbi:amidohydrolase family protein [Pontibacillus yanchengensis]|uniref:2-amino-3-carboxymuconate-6-semialdehyde decarboxylase n=2 Tax=Pontibacillus yanchengensis TaxID=462910 RepID=A0A6I4ZW83_9BACI|nr:amidohydrolase family protein [Pontibacillus yanchengensis]MYL32112.1 amidohydrolase family protein [Pontibacillus yanchengensis]MYL52692.1 amidohydrolase family protein [Pontibacillus yanchengensis]